MVKHLLRAACGSTTLALCLMFLPGQALAQAAGAGLGLGGAGILNDPFAFYYAVYLPNQQLQAMRPRPMDTINDTLVTRQYYAQNDRRGLYNPISPYADQNYDPLHPYSRQQGTGASPGRTRSHATHPTSMERARLFITGELPNTFPASDLAEAVMPTSTPEAVRRDLPAITPGEVRVLAWAAAWAAWAAVWVEWEWAVWVE